MTEVTQDDIDHLRQQMEDQIELVREHLREQVQSLRNEIDTLGDEMRGLVR